MIKAEVAQIDINNINIAKDKISHIKNILESIVSTKEGKETKIQETIQDSEIVNLSKNLKSRRLKVSDLF
jgi:hypothetical protein